jgi:hypothetical protein
MSRTSSSKSRAFHVLKMARAIRSRAAVAALGAEQILIAAAKAALCALPLSEVEQAWPQERRKASSETGTKRNV